MVLVAPGTYREAVVVRTPRVVEANRTDLAYYLGTVKAAPADKANCFAEHRFATSSPAGIETALPCASKANTNRPGTVPTLIRGASSLGYRKVRLPPTQPDMADALTAPPRPAVDGPPTVEVAKLQVPG